MLTALLMRSPPDRKPAAAPKDDQVHEHGVPAEDSEDEEQETLTRTSSIEPRPLLTHRGTAGDASETSPLLTTGSRESRGSYGLGHGSRQGVDLEGQKSQDPRKWLGKTADSIRDTRGRVVEAAQILSNPKRWDRRALWKNVVVAPVACLPAVVVGLLLNILDALSYGEQTHASVGLPYANLA